MFSCWAYELLQSLFWDNKMYLFGLWIKFCRLWHPFLILEVFGNLKALLSTLYIGVYTKNTQCEALWMSRQWLHFSLPHWAPTPCWVNSPADCGSPSQIYFLIQFPNTLRVTHWNDGWFPIKTFPFRWLILSDYSPLIEVIFTP